MNAENAWAGNGIAFLSFVSSLACYNLLEKNFFATSLMAAILLGICLLACLWYLMSLTFATGGLPKPLKFFWGEEMVRGVVMFVITMPVAFLAAVLASQSMSGGWQGLFLAVFVWFAVVFFVANGLKNISVEMCRYLPTN